MAVGALIDLCGLNSNPLAPFVKGDLLHENIELKYQKIFKKGISAVKFDVFDKSSHKHADHSSYHIEHIEKIILDAPPTSVLRKRLIEKGMITIKQDGFLNVLNGITTIKEVERVAGK